MALTRYEGSENQGGVCQLRILKRADFEINQVIIERYRGEGFIKISANEGLENVFPVNYFTHFVAEHTQPTKRSQHGHYNEQGFTFSLSKDRPDILAQITQLQDEPLVIIFKNNNHDWKVIGTEEDWAMIDAAQETGTRPSDTNQYFFDVKCSSRYLSPFLEFEKRTIVLPPPEPTDPPCVPKVNGYTVTNPFGIEIRLPFNTSLAWVVAGVIRIEWILTRRTKLTIRSVQSSIIFDTRVVGPGQGSYSFVKNGEGFLIIFEAPPAPLSDLQTITAIRDC